MKINPRGYLMLLAIIFASLVSACATKEAVYENVYEGLKTRNRVYPEQPNSAPTEPMPSYGRYETERKKLLSKPETP